MMTEKRRHNANARGSIGIDTSYLDKQVEEKRLRDSQIARQKKQEAEYIQQFSKRLDEYEAAANFKKSQKLQDFRQTLAEQVKQPKNNALADGEVELDKCGPSSIQIFEGEDDAYTERKKIQQQQLKSWCSELMAEKERVRLEEEKREQEYASHVLRNDEILEHMGEKVAKRKQERASQLAIENMRMAKEAELRREVELQKEKEAQAEQSRHLHNCQLLTENKTVATNQMQPHRVRPDHFKGFDKDQIQNFYRDNDAVMEEKRTRSAKEAQLEAEWAEYEATMLVQMDEADRLRKQHKMDEAERLRNQLDRQREEYRVRNAKTEVAGIGTGFFERFGNSCR